ncbi:hypothetical protein QBK93_34190 [Rhizobium leguminosarum]|nr:hypothetical protein [Rhizobium leguminosarum]MDI5929663.1 hypothetical protein [Rhizobium leguminosarum]
MTGPSRLGIVVSSRFLSPGQRFPKSALDPLDHACFVDGKLHDGVEPQSAGL